MVAWEKKVYSAINSNDGGGGAKRSLKRSRDINIKGPEALNFQQWDTHTLNFKENLAIDFPWNIFT